MKHLHYERYFSGEYSLDVSESVGGEILGGRMCSRTSTDRFVHIEGGVPRFVSGPTYAENFGQQWNEFRTTQLDSRTGLPLSFNRFWNNTKWKPSDVKGCTILEVGCGAGRFTEVMLEAGASVVSVDLSAAVIANYQNNASRGDLLVAQADLYNLPFPDQSFDFVFCYGVLQHTPDPAEAYKRIFSKLRNGGQISIDYYHRSRLPGPLSTPKYLWRPLSTRIKPETLLRIVQTYIPVWLPIDTALKKTVGRIPRIGNVALGLIPIPCWNYYGLPLPQGQLVEWAILDTFDALGAQYDLPKTLDEVRDMVASPDSERTNVFFGSNGVVANAHRRI